VLLLVRASEVGECVRERAVVGDAIPGEPRLVASESNHPGRKRHPARDRGGPRSRAAPANPESRAQLERERLSLRANDDRRMLVARIEPLCDHSATPDLLKEQTVVGSRTDKTARPA